MMNCEETQKAFSPYLDGALTREAGDALGEHLGACPVCRQQLEETRSVVRGLSLLARPASPPNLSASIKDSLIIERAARVASPPLSLSERATRWVSVRLMPYTVGAVYSMVLFVAELSGNGGASPAAVVEPPRNRRMIDELQDAFRQSPAFVPASLDRRPQTMRVVFVLQKMNVADRSY